MGFSKLEKAVLGKAKSEADRIAKEAAGEILAAEKEFAAERDRELAMAREESKTACAGLIRRKVAQKKLEAKKRLLLAKKELIDAAFARAAGELGNRLSETERKKLIARLLDSARKEIDLGTVHSNREDAKYLPSARRRDMLGGFIAESKDSSTLVDCSFESMLDEIKEKRLSEITSLLFK